MIAFFLIPLLMFLKHLIDLKSHLHFTHQQALKDLPKATPSVSIIIVVSEFSLHVITYFQKMKLLF